MDNSTIYKITHTGHCINRLKERFGLGPQDYHELLGRIKAGAGTIIESSKLHQNTYTIKIKYKGHIINARYDSSRQIMSTVF